MTTIEEGRFRCRGDKHKSHCAHLGLDPTRTRCQGDKHKSHCAHLSQRLPSRPVGRPRKARKARSDSRVSRSIARPIPEGGTSTRPGPLPIAIERETPPVTQPYKGVVGPEITISTITRCRRGQHRPDCQHLNFVTGPRMVPVWGACCCAACHDADPRYVLTCHNLVTADEDPNLTMVEYMADPAAGPQAPWTTIYGNGFRSLELAAIREAA